MVRQSVQGTGIGRALTSMRISHIMEDPGVRRIALQTSRHTEAFYTKMGFRTEQVVPDGIAPGMDRYDMLMETRP